MPASLGVPHAGRSGVLAALARLLLALCGLVPLLILVGDLGPAGLTVGFLPAVVPIPGLPLPRPWIDRYVPEPRLLGWAFFWGATRATLVALVVNSAGQAIVGGAFGNAVGQLYLGSFSAAVLRGGGQGWSAVHDLPAGLPRVDRVLHGIVYAGMVVLGFAFTEKRPLLRADDARGRRNARTTFFVRGSSRRSPIPSSPRSPAWGSAGLGRGGATRR